MQRVCMLFSPLIISPTMAKGPMNSVALSVRPSVRPSVHPPVTSFFGIGIFSQIFCMKLGFNKHARLVDPIFLREILVMPKMGVN